MSCYADEQYDVDNSSKELLAKLDSLVKEEILTEVDCEDDDEGEYYDDEEE